MADENSPGYWLFAIGFWLREQDQVAARLPHSDLVGAVEGPPPRHHRRETAEPLDDVLDVVHLEEDADRVTANLLHGTGGVLCDAFGCLIHQLDRTLGENHEPQPMTLRHCGRLLEPKPIGPER